MPRPPSPRPGCDPRRWPARPAGIHPCCLGRSPRTPAAPHPYYATASASVDTQGQPTSAVVRHWSDLDTTVISLYLRQQCRERLDLVEILSLEEVVAAEDLLCLQKGPIRRDGRTSLAATTQGPCSRRRLQLLAVDD